MAVIVTDMRMPENCTECPFATEKCLATAELVEFDRRADNCPLKSIDGLIKELEEKASWYMYDDWGNTTAVHDEVVRIIKKYCGEEKE